MAKKPHKKLLKYTTTYSVDGATKTLTYARAEDPDHRDAEDTFNINKAEEFAEYQAACELGVATDVKIKTEEIFVG